jgi:hypothetical protein
VEGAAWKEAKVVVLSVDFCIAEAFRLLAESSKMEDKAQRLRLLQGASGWLQIAQNWTANSEDVDRQRSPRSWDSSGPDGTPIPRG